MIPLTFSMGPNFTGEKKINVKLRIETLYSNMIRGVPE